MTSKRIYGLDILRTLAILFVVFLHAILFLPPIVLETIKYHWVDGVVLFFVLSGFLIGKILIKILEKGDFLFSELRQFLIRRWLRTLPAYFVTMLVLLLAFWLIEKPVSIYQAIKHLTFTQAMHNNIATFYPEGWSLSVEEWFYLLIPVGLFIALRFLSWEKALGIMILFVIISSGILRYWRMQQIDYSDVNIWNVNIRMATFLRMDSIMYGFLGAYLFHIKHKFWIYKNLWFWFGIALFILAIFSPSKTFSRHFELPLESLATLFLLPKLSSIESGSGAVYRSISFISTISYSLYLVNFTPFNIIIGSYIVQYFYNGPDDNLYYIIIFTAFLIWAFVGAYMLHRFVEKPFMAMRDNIFVKNYKPLEKAG